MKVKIQYRIAEQHLRSIDLEGSRASVPGYRVMHLAGDDPRWPALAKVFAENGGAGFFDWSVERRFSSGEIDRAMLHLLEIKTGVLPTGEECGTVYDDRKACSLCGAGRMQITPLRLRLTNMPRRAEIAQTWGGEVVVSARVVQLLTAAGMTGFGLGPVQRSKKGEEEPFSLSETHAGKIVLGAAADAGVRYPSPEFYVWANRPEQREAFTSAVKAHETRKVAGRRLFGGTTADWYQLIVTARPISLAGTTVFGSSPFAPDFEGRNRCPAGVGQHVVGEHRLSHVTLDPAEWVGADLARSSVLIGRRAGLFNPVPLLFMSARLRDLLIRNAVRGWTSEVVSFTGDGGRKLN